MSLEDLWLPLVDDPIGALVERLHDADPKLAALVDSPRRQLAFRTFAYVRVGLVLGQLLVEHEVDPETSRTWVEQVLDDPRNVEAVARVVRAVAREVAADPKLVDEEPFAPGDDPRERFRELTRRLDASTARP